MQITANRRKIIHIDMDCFFAAVEIRDNPKLAKLPVAVGGSTSRRGVISTCNYIARKYGVHSAMPTAFAYRLCPDLIVLRGNIQKYKEISYGIKEILQQYTDTIEMISLDEAYLDVSYSRHCYNSATWMAQKIRADIFREFKLVASAGAAPNKFLAKIASEWNKPNGHFVITPDDIDGFMPKLPVKNICGVGRVTANKLHRMGISTCGDLQKYPKRKIMKRFGKFGQKLCELSYGLDNRQVQPYRERKSLSVEHTFAHDIAHINDAAEEIEKLYMELTRRLSKHNREISKQFIKIKFSDFCQTTVERRIPKLSKDSFNILLQEGYDRKNHPFRLLGLGVQFTNDTEPMQLDLLEG